MCMPELKRNLWLEFTPHRLIATPIVLMAIFYLAHLINGMQTMYTVAFYLYLIFAFVWGTRCASASLCDEINERTWDWQRMSQQGPLSIGLGKLLGSTSYTWFGASMAFFGFVWIGASLHEPELGLKALILLFGALFTHTLALLFSLEAIHDNRNQKLSSFKYFATALIIGWITVAFVYKVASSGFGQVQWHGYLFPIKTFYLVSFMIFLMWSLIGLYRNFRSELQYRNIPWAWGLFTLFMMVYFSGFANMNIPDQDFPKSLTDVKAALHHGPLYTAFIVALLLTYIPLLTENIGVLRYKKIYVTLKEGQWINTLERLPRWPVTFIGALMVGLWLMTKSPISLTLEHTKLSFNPFVFSLSWLLLVTRDILIAHYFHFGLTYKRLTWTILFYLAVLYILIPGLLSLMHSPFAVALFLPGTGAYPIASIIGPLIQISVVGWLVIGRWKQGAI